MGEVLIGWEMQTDLYLNPLEQVIVFAAHDRRQSCQVCQDGSRPIVSIQAQERTLRRVVVRAEGALNGRHRPAQFSPVLPIARIAVCGEPLVRMTLQDGGTRTHDFPSFAPSVAGSTQGTQASRWSWPIYGHWQSPLARGFACAIDIEDGEVVSLSVPQST
jgi:hypothetical protein